MDITLVLSLLQDQGLLTDQMDVSLFLGHLQDEGVLSADQVANPQLAHEALTNLDESELAKALSEFSKGEDVTTFSRWLAMSGDEAAAFAKQHKLFGETSSKVQRVSKVTLIDSEISPHQIAVTNQYAPHFTAVLQQSELQRSLQTSRNAGEEYLHIINYLLDDTHAKKSGLNDAQRTAVIWESLAHVDTERSGSEVSSLTTNTELKSAFQNAVDYLQARHMEPMSQFYLQMRIGGVRVALLPEGQGADYLNLIRRRTEEQPIVARLYEHLKIILEDNPDNPIDLDALMDMDRGDPRAWFNTNAVHHSLPAIDLYQILRFRGQEAFGLQARDLAATSGQSQGLVRAFGTAGAFGVPEADPLVPTAIEGTSSLQALENEVSWMSWEGWLYHALAPYIEGKTTPAVSLARIPFEVDNEEALLNRIMAEINKKLSKRTGRTMQHVQASNRLVGNPHYFTLVTGTTEGITELERLLKTKNATDYSQEVQNGIAALTNNIRVIDHRTLGVSAPVHHREIFKDGPAKLIAKMQELGISLGKPVLSLFGNSTIYDLLTTDPEMPLDDFLAQEQFWNLVDVHTLISQLAEKVDVIIGAGPDNTLLPTFGRKITDKVKMLGFDADDDVALLNSRNPHDIADLLGQKQSIANQVASAVEKLKQIPGITIQKQDQIEGNRTRVLVSLDKKYSDANKDDFYSTFVGEYGGAIHALFKADNLNRDGKDVANPFQRVLSPTAGNLKFEWIVGADGFESVKIFEGRKLVLEVDAPNAEGIIDVHEFTHVNGRADLVRKYKVDGEQVREITDGYIERARQAYAQDWGFELDGIFNADFEPLPEDLLSRVNLEYDFELTADMIRDFGLAMDGVNPEKPHAAILKNVVGREGLLKLMFVKAFGLDMPNVINLGGSEQVKPFYQLKPGKFHVKSSPVELTDVNLGLLQGRRLSGKMEITDENGEVVASFRSRLFSNMANDLEVGQTRAVAPPREKFDSTFNFFEGFTLYPLQNHPVVMEGDLIISTDAARRNKWDKNRIHEQKLSAQMTGKRDVVMQGEGVLSRAIDEVLDGLTGGRPEYYAGMNIVSEDPQMRGYTYQGDRLTYEVTLNRHGEGLNEYNLKFYRAEGPGKKGTLLLEGNAFVWDEPPLYVFTGQGDQYAGMDVDFLKFSSAERLQYFQSLMDQSSHPVNLQDAMSRGSMRTDETQPIYMAYDFGLEEQARSLGLIHRHPAGASGNSLGIYPAIKFAGGLETDTSIAAVGERGHVMNSYVSDDNPQGLSAVTLKVDENSPTYLRQFKRNLEALCIEMSQDPDSVVVVGNKNHYGQFVLSGHVSAINRMFDAMKADPAKWGKARYGRMLPVATGFHSPTMKEAAVNMLTYFLQHKPLKPLKIPVIMDTTGEFLPMKDTRAIAQALADQIASSTEFIKVCETAFKAGIRSFREIGPSEGGTILAFVANNAKVNGINPDTLDSRALNPARSPDDWSYITKEAVNKIDRHRPWPQPKVVAKPALVQASTVVQPGELAAQVAQAVVPVSTSAPMLDEPKGPVYRNISPVEIHQAGVSVSQAAEGDKTVLKYFLDLGIGTDAESIERDTGSYAQMAAKLAQTYVALEPNAIELMQAESQYLRGLLGMGGNLVASVGWTREEIISQVFEILKRNFTKVTDEKIMGVKSKKADLDIHLEKDLGVDSQEMGDVWAQFVAVFGTPITLDDKFGKKLPMKSLVEYLEDRMANPMVVPQADASAPVRNYFMIKVRALETAIAELTSIKQRAERAASQVSSGGDFDVSAAGAVVSEEALATLGAEIESKIQKGVDTRLTDMVRNFAASMGVEVNEGIALEFDPKTSEVSRPGEAKAKADAAKLAAAEKGLGREAISNTVSSWKPEFEFIYKNAHVNGGRAALIRIVSQVRMGDTPKDFAAEMNHVANQLDQNMVDRLENIFIPDFTKQFGADHEKVIQLRYFVDRAKASLQARGEGKGGLFDNVITLHGLSHIPVEGETGKTNVLDRNLSTQEIINHYEQLGMNPEMIQALREMVKDGSGLYGKDIILAGAGTIGGPLAAMFLQLGARVIILDRKQRNEKMKDGSNVNTFYKKLRNRYAIAGIEDQLIVEFGSKIGNHDDITAINNHLKAKGIKPAGIFNMAAVSDYGSILQKGEPHKLLDIYALFPMYMAAYWADVAAKEGWENPVFISDHPTPNHNDIKGTRFYYFIKSILEEGRIQEILFNEKVRLQNGSPAVKGISILTPWSNPEEGIDVGAVMKSGSARLMEMLALYADALEKYSRDEYGVEIYTTVGNEPAAMTVATFLTALRQGKEAPINKHYAGADLNFKALMLAAEAKGKTLDEVIQEVKDIVDAKLEAKAKTSKKIATDPTIVPNDGHVIDLNELARRFIIDPRGVEGRFKDKVPFAVSPHTTVAIGAGAIGPGSWGLFPNFRFLAHRSKPAQEIVTPEMEWLFHRDNYHLARSLQIDVKGLSLEDIERIHIDQIDRNVGFRKLPEADRFETQIKMPSPADLRMPIPRAQLANFARFGWTVEESKTGEFFAVIKKGESINIPIATKWPVSVWNDIPGGKENFNWQLAGITSDKDLKQSAPAAYMARIVVAGALRSAGMDANDMHTIAGAEGIFASLTLALAELEPFMNTATDPKTGDKPVMQSSMSKLLGDAAVGQMLMEQLGAMGAPLALVAACATGVFNITNVIKHLYAHMWKAKEFGQGSMAQALNQFGFGGGVEYAAMFTSVLGFYAVGALITDEHAEKFKIPDDERSRGTAEDAGGFVGGTNGGVLLQTPYETAVKNGKAPWSAQIAFAEQTDGSRLKAREGFGDGVKVAIRNAIIDAKRFLPVDATEYILVVDAHLTSTPGDPLEMAAVLEVLVKELNLPKGYSIYIQAIKDGTGHGLGGIGAYAAAMDQITLNRRLVLGAKSFDNMKMEIGDNGHITLTNETIDLTKLYGSDKPIVLVLEGFGFNGKDGVVVMTVPPIVATDRDHAVKMMSQMLRSQIQARADERAERQNKTTLVQYFQDAKKFDVREFKDLWAAYSRSEAIAEILIDQVRLGKLKLDFDHILEWAPMLKWDSDITPLAEDQSLEAAFGRIQTTLADLRATGDIDQIRSVAQQNKTHEHAVLKLGASDGMAFRRTLAEIEAGAIDNVVAVSYDPPNGERYWNAIALQMYAKSKGIRMEIFNESAIIVDTETHQSGYGPNEKITATFDKIAEAIERARARAINKDLNIDNSIAFGKPMRMPGETSISVPSIDALGRLFFATVPVAIDEHDVRKRTMDTMGRNVVDILNWAKLKGYLGATSRTTHLDWRNGKLIKDTTGFGGVYYGGGALGPAKDEARAGIEAFGSENLTLGTHQVIGLPAFMSQALGAIPGGWLFGLVGKGVMDQTSLFMSMEKLATQGYLRQYSGDGSLMVDVDGHEVGIIDEATEKTAEVGRRMARFVAEHPDLLETDPTDETIKYIPFDLSQGLMDGLVTPDSLKILESYLTPEQRQAKQMAVGESPIHGGMASVNPDFALPRFATDAEISYTKESATFNYVLPPEFNGYSGITHGGMLNNIFESAYRLYNKTSGKKLSKDIIRHIVYRANAISGSAVTIQINYPKDKDVSIDIKSGDQIIAQAFYAKSTIENLADGKSKVTFLNAKSESQESFEVASRAALKPGSLKADLEFGCLPGCVAAGHAHSTGLQFKYAFDRTKNALWGVIDPIQSQDPLYAIMLAADDLAAWIGMRAAKTWGYTTSNTVHQVSQIRADERLFLVAEAPKNAGPSMMDVLVNVMNAFGEVRAVVRAKYAPNEAATLNGIKGAIEAAKNTQDTLAARALAFLKESMGETFEGFAQQIAGESSNSAVITAGTFEDHYPTGAAAHTGSATNGVAKDSLSGDQQSGGGNTAPKAMHVGADLAGGIIDLASNVINAAHLFGAGLQTVSPAVDGNLALKLGLEEARGETPLSWLREVPQADSLSADSVLQLLQANGHDDFVAFAGLAGTHIKPHLMTLHEAAHRQDGPTIKEVRIEIAQKLTAGNDNVISVGGKDFDISNPSSQIYLGGQSMLPAALLPGTMAGNLIRFSGIGMLR